MEVVVESGLKPKVKKKDSSKERKRNDLVSRICLKIKRIMMM